MDTKGLYKKYDVRRTDGTDQPGGKHEGCEYFVLDLTHDEHARYAAWVYANAVEDIRPELAKDLKRHLYQFEADKPT